MRHFLFLAGPVAGLAGSMIETSPEGLLIASACLPLPLSADTARAGGAAVNVAAVKAGADRYLSMAAGTAEKAAAGVGFHRHPDADEGGLSQGKSRTIAHGRNRGFGKRFMTAKSLVSCHIFFRQRGHFLHYSFPVNPLATKNRHGMSHCSMTVGHGGGICWFEREVLYRSGILQMAIFARFTRFSTAIHS